MNCKTYTGTFLIAYSGLEFDDISEMEDYDDTSDFNRTTPTGTISNTIPNTGDMSPAALAAVMLASLTAVLLLAVKRRKNEDEV